uniref:Uncharacterized protein n=1 Tax=Timema poppense TaxID=170557 RepID=A0A7R9DIV4_TIMPO|nr:unnamed protein product [Timema poppensis]
MTAEDLHVIAFDMQQALPNPPLLLVRHSLRDCHGVLDTINNIAFMLMLCDDIIACINLAEGLIQLSVSTLFLATCDRDFGTTENNKRTISNWKNVVSMLGENFGTAKQVLENITERTARRTPGGCFRVLMSALFETGTVPAPDDTMSVSSDDAESEGSAHALFETGTVPAPDDTMSVSSDDAESEGSAKSPCSPGVGLMFIAMEPLPWSCSSSPCSSLLDHTQAQASLVLSPHAWLTSSDTGDTVSVLFTVSLRAKHLGVLQPHMLFSNYSGCAGEGQGHFLSLFSPGHEECVTSFWTEQPLQTS